MIRMVMTPYKMIKKHCELSNGWLANRFEMDHYAGMRITETVFQERETGRRAYKRFKVK
jgi:hypothetical protein